MRLKFLLVIVLISQLAVKGQVHVAPPDGAPGIPGIEPRSFVIAWKSVPGAVAYEYVMSDNFYCEVGCLGDTRQATVGDTFAVEYELIEGKPYYWITRAHLANGESTGWTLISSFMAITPPPGNLVRISPNPVIDHLQLAIDWQRDERITQINLEVVDMQGQVLLPERVAADRQIGPRRVEIQLPRRPSEPGLFLARLTFFNSRGQQLGEDIQKFILTD